MTDYHVFSLSSPPSPTSSPPTVVDHGVALSVEDVPWAEKQLWAPDAAEKNGKYYLFFPARDREGVFRIGVAVSEKPEGPFKAQEKWIEGSYSIDPAVFVDDDEEKSAYVYFGGIWGGQLQCWTQSDGKWIYDKESYSAMEPSGDNVPALGPRVAKLRENMLEFDGEGVKEVEILDGKGEKIRANDHKKRFFEASWVHKHQGLYYFSYSTGDCHEIVYATGKSPFGPFTYRGVLLKEVLGWTTHHSIVEWEGKWWLFYHDASLSGGKNHLRSVKVREIVYGGEGGEELFLKEKQDEEDGN